MGLSQNSFGLKTTGALWAWGANFSGQLGNNTNTSYSSPIAVVGSHIFTYISQFGNFTLTAASADVLVAALKNTGAAWMWGRNFTGEIGNNTTGNSYSSPVAVVGAHSFIQIVPGNAMCIALKSNTGAAWSWGYNTGGALADGTVTSRSSPVPVVGAHSFQQIAAGGDSTAGSGGGIKANGQMWVWGMNTYGQLGTNNQTSYSSPVQVVGSHSFEQIRMGGAIAAGIKSDGSVWMWGINNNGQLGNNSATLSFSSPVTVVGSHSFIDVKLGANHTMALKSDGSCWTWGDNTYGELGINISAVSRESPVLVVGSHSFIQIASGWNYSAGLKTDGSTWVWGSNAFGTLGTNDGASYSSPVAVVGSHIFVQLWDQVPDIADKLCIVEEGDE